MTLLLSRDDVAKVLTMPDCIAAVEGAFAALARMGQLAARVPRLRRVVEELSHTTAQIQVRGAFALMVAFIVLAEGLGTEIILGAFFWRVRSSRSWPNEKARTYI